MDYQKTLNLPKTDFSMRAGLAQKEPVFLQQWEKNELWKALRAKAAGCPEFILHDGPPYANGNIHIGHALNKILKDFVVKYKTMRGFDSWYVPGWDCHGLPIEHQLLKELKQRKHEVDCADFRQKAHDYAMKYVGVQREQFQRLGVFGDWEHPYLTLAKDYEYWILKSLGTLNEKGYVYRGLKPVNWCFNCETALAEAEVEYEDHTSKSVYVRFAADNPDAIGGLPAKPLSLLIWTTTPWTLIANVAVALHASFEYSIVDLGTEMVIVERSLRDAALSKAGVAGAKVLKGVDGKNLTQLTYTHPFGMRTNCPVVAADYVTKEDGTGLVHTAPGHGQEDYETGRKYNLDIVMPVDDRGIYTDEAGKYAGEHVFKANDKILEDLKAQGALFASEDLPHSYPHCWRCKKPIIFRATQQWFLKIDHENLRGQLKRAVKEQVEWIPASGEERILGMVTGRPDWCLSRQRYWGVPIPAVECKGCGGTHRLFGGIIEHFAEIVKEEGTDAWFKRDISELIPKGFRCPVCGKAEFEKTRDILDVWFDSGVSHQAVVKSMMGKALPIAMYLEGSDQHRGWFQSSLIPAVAMEGKPPFKSVLTHGFVVDGQGRKMSKSLGNVVSPQDIIKDSGADILRLWVAASSYNEDIRISKEILARLIDAYRKIRNTFRYLLGNFDGFDPESDVVPYDRLVDLDKWALAQLHRAMGEIQANFNKYEFAKVYRSIYTFCNEELSSFYLDILKDRLYTSAAQSGQRKSAQTVLYHILNHLVRALAPILSFTAEEIFAAMPKDTGMKNTSSVHLLDWLDPSDVWANAEIEQRYELLVTLRPFVLKALEDKRRVGEIGSSLEAKVIFKTASVRDLACLRDNEKQLPSVFIVSQVEVQEHKDIKEGLSEAFPQTTVEIQKADGQKCSRCWNFKTDVGADKGHPLLCGRCREIVKEIQTGV